jgi:hypothetical protein
MWTMVETFVQNLGWVGLGLGVMAVLTLLELVLRQAVNLLGPPQGHRTTG